MMTGTPVRWSTTAVGLLGVAGVLMASPRATLAQKASAFAGDARMDRPVTVRWKKATLRDALAEVSKATGAKLTPERAIVDEPVLAAASGMSARQLLEQTAELLDYTWVRNGGTAEAPAYLLYQSRSQKDAEQAMVDQGKREVLAALNKELERYRSALRLPPNLLAEQVEKSDQKFGELLQGGFQNASSPKGMTTAMDAMAMRSVASPTGRVMVELLDRLSPAQWSTLTDEEALVFSPRPTSGETPFPTGMYDRLKNATPDLPLPKSIFRSLGPQAEEGITMAENMMREKWSQAGSLKVTVTLSLSMASSPTGMLRVVPVPEGDDPTNGIFAIAGLNIIGVPQSLTEEEEDAEARAQRLGADPFLGKKAKLELPKAQPLPGVGAGPFAGLNGTQRTADVALAVEKAFGVRILSDAYNRLAITPVALPNGELPLFKALDAISGGSRRWDVKNGLVRFRSKTWAQDRRAEIPVYLMQRWKERSTRQGGLTLDDQAEMATTLRDEQVENLMLAGMEAEMTDFMEMLQISSNKGILRLYGRLLPQQRRALLIGQPIAARQLYPFQQPLLVSMQKAQSRSFMAFAMTPKPSRSPQLLANAVISLERSPAFPPSRNPRQPILRDTPGSSATYTFRLTFPDGQKDQYAVPVDLRDPTKPVAPPEVVPDPDQP